MNGRLKPVGIAVAGVMLVAVTGCGNWQRVGSETEPDPSQLVPRLFDPTTVYAGMGFLARGAPLPFVATLRFLAASTPDTSIAVFGLSLANNALSFRRTQQAFEARYRVEVVFQRDGAVVRRIASDERVRVGSRQEALRADESVIFQQFIRVPPGSFEATVSVRDQHGGAFSSAAATVQVPRYSGSAVSDLIPIYQGAGRGSRGDLPTFLVNPRATAPYGLDSLVLYLEGYGQPTGTDVAVRAISPAGESLWTTTTPWVFSNGLAQVMVVIPPERLPVGELVLVASVGATGDSVVAPALVSFSDQWVITNFDEVLALLRHFGEDRAVNAMRDADPAERPALWRAFWEETDPNPATPENEALTLYFRRVQIANVRFQEAGDPGWLTDRGEVFITLGEPDEIFDQSSALQGQRRVIRWNYIGERLTLDFVDDTGFGRFRLTPLSRSEYLRVVNRVRRRS